MEAIDIMNNVNRVGFGPTIRTENHMAKIATEDQFVEDVHGVRRQIKKGDQVPPGLFDLSKVKTEDADIRTLARPVVDEEASKSHAERTGAEPSKEGVSTERAKELQKKQREAAKSDPQSRGGGHRTAAVKE